MRETRLSDFRVLPSGFADHPAALRSKPNERFVSLRFPEFQLPPASMRLQIGCVDES